MGGKWGVGGVADLFITVLLLLDDYKDIPLAKEGRILLISSRRILSSDLARCSSCVGSTGGSSSGSNTTVIAHINGGVTTTARRCLEGGKLRDRVGGFT